MGGTPREPETTRKTTIFMKISLENRFFTRLAKLVNSLHENGCFSMLSVFRGVPPNLLPFPGLLASCWPLAGLWLLAGLLPVLAGHLLASCWPLAGFLLASASCWPLASLLLASSWLLAGLLLACCKLLAGLLLASSWPLAGLFLASCWLLAGFKLPHEDFSRKSVFGKAQYGESSS